MTTPTNEAGHGLPELPAPNKIAHDLLIDLRAAAAIGRPITGDEIHEIEQRMIAALALSRGVPEPARYFADGPQGFFFADDLKLARDLVNLYDKSDDWTITDLSNPTGAAPAAAGAQGEGQQVQAKAQQRGECTESASLKEIVPSEKRNYLDANGNPRSIEDEAYAHGWNACRSATIKKLELITTPQPAAADGGVREPFVHEVRCAQFNRPCSCKAIALSSHRQAGDGLSKFRELAERWRKALDRSGVSNDEYAHGFDVAKSDCLHELKSVLALVEKGAGNG